jgi:hypothetical protein
MKEMRDYIIVGIIGIAIGYFVLPGADSIKVVKEIKVVEKKVDKIRTVYQNKVTIREKIITKDGQVIEREKIVEKPIEIEKEVIVEKEKEIVKYDQKLYSAGIVVSPFNITSEFGISAGLKLFNSFQLQGVILQKEFREIRGLVILQVLF